MLIIHADYHPPLDAEVLKKVAQSSALIEL
jgi:hypothetical protein